MMMDDISSWYSALIQLLLKIKNLRFKCNKVWKLTKIKNGIFLDRETKNPSKKCFQTKMWFKIAHNADFLLTKNKTQLCRTKKDAGLVFKILDAAVVIHSSIYFFQCIFEKKNCLSCVGLDI